MRSRIAAFALAASLFSAASANAQTQQHFTFVNGGSVSAYGYSVGPYLGSMGASGGSQQSVILNCVDFFHHVTVGEQWDANLTSLATGAGIGVDTRSSNIVLYKEAAYLTSQYGMSGINANDVRNIQITIWDLFNNTNLGFFTGGLKSSSYWLSAAQSNYANMSFNNWYVVTDVNKSASNSVQEFLMYNPNVTTTATPEPNTVALMATGFIGLAGVGIRRRKKNA